MWSEWDTNERKKQIKSFINAAADGNLDKVKQAIEEGVPVNSLIKAGNESALDHACMNNYYDVAEYLLSNGANPNYINSCQCHSLIHAACKDYKDIALLLLDNGADKNIIGQNKNAAAWARSRGKVGVAKVIDNYVKEGWLKIDDNEVEYNYRESKGKRHIKDVFNFYQEERTRYTTLVSTGQECMAITRFQQVNPKIMKEAFGTLREGKSNKKPIRSVIIR